VWYSLYYYHGPGDPPQKRSISFWDPGPFPSNTRFFGPTRVQTLNDILIGSAVFAQLTYMVVGRFVHLRCSVDWDDSYTWCGWVQAADHVTTRITLTCRWTWKLATKCARFTHYVLIGHYDLGWLGSRVVSMLDSGAERPGFKSQRRRCRETVLGRLFTPIVPLFTKQQNW